MITTAVALVVGIAGTLGVRAWFRAVERGMQKREIANMRSIANALDAYRRDHAGYPAADSIDALGAALAPKYMPNGFPAKDVWSYPLQYRASGVTYTLYSVGKDGYGANCEAGVTTKLEDETCVVDGRFVRYPEDQAGSAIPR